MAVNSPGQQALGQAPFSRGADVFKTGGQPRGGVTKAAMKW
jgi:hypothetical protein